MRDQGNQALIGVMDPELLMNCARSIEDEFPFFSAELRKKADAERAALASTKTPTAPRQLSAEGTDWTERN